MRRTKNVQTLSNSSTLSLMPARTLDASDRSNYNSVMAILRLTPEDTSIILALPPNRKSLLEQQWESEVIRPQPIPVALGSSHQQEHHPPPDEHDLQDEVPPDVDMELVENHLLSIQNQFIRELA